MFRHPARCDSVSVLDDVLDVTIEPAKTGAGYRAVVLVRLGA